jgi:hypothetical protein
MGSLDAGTAEAMENYLTGITTTGTYLPGSKQNLYGREQLRGLKVDVARKLMDWERQYQLQLNDPKVQDPYARVIGPTKAPPKESPSLNRIETQPEPAPNQPRKNRAGGLIIEPPEAAPNQPTTTRKNRAGGLIY